MRSYDFANKWQKLLTPRIVALLTRIYEYKGEQSFLIKAKGLTLTNFMKVAKFQSTLASNKIEGIVISNDRLHALMAEKTLPKTRNEQEIATYRDVLNTIHVSFDYISITSNIIL